MAAGIARAAARRGLRTLACEMDAKGSLASALGVARPGFAAVDVEPSLRVMVMDTEASLREYLRVHLKLPLVAKIGPLASMFDFVADAAPGVKEILSVGKVCWEVREDHYDLVVVDAEASGHVVSQISSPRVINTLVPRGPLRDQTNWMLEILDDPARCGVLVVSSPEDLAVTESIDLIARLRAETSTSVVAVVANLVDESPVPADDQEAVARICRIVGAGTESWPGDVVSLVTTTNALVSRHAESNAQVARLREAVGSIPMREVPRLSCTDPVEVANVIAARLTDEDS